MLARCASRHAPPQASHFSKYNINRRHSGPHSGKPTPASKNNGRNARRPSVTHFRANQVSGLPRVGTFGLSHQPTSAQRRLTFLNTDIFSRTLFPLVLARQQTQRIKQLYKLSFCTAVCKAVAGRKAPAIACARKLASGNRRITARVLYNTSVQNASLHNRALYAAFVGYRFVMSRTIF